MSVLADPSWWVWAERASWIIPLAAAAVGVLVGLYRLRAWWVERRGRADEATRKPVLRAGFGVSIEPARSLRLDPHEMFLGLSKTVDFDIHVANTGRKTARDILLNVLFDAAIESEHARRAIRSIDGRHFDPDQESGTSVIVRQIPYVHPGDYNVLELAWRFPFRRAEYDVLVEASAADVETLSVRLKLRVTTEPEVRRLLLGR